MVFKFICQYLDTSFIILPNQGDETSYKKSIYSLDCYLIPDTKKNNIFLDKNGIYLCFVEIKDNNVNPIIIEILKTLLPVDIFNDKIAKDNIIYNAKILSGKGDDRISVPIPNDLYIDQLTWDFINASFDIGETPLLIGPKGCGKTSTGHAVAKVKGYDFYPINCGAISKPKGALVGTVKAKDGSTYFNEARFIKHYTAEIPTIIYLQELSRIQEPVANFLMTALEEPHSYIYLEDEGKVVYKGENVRFMADANFGIGYSGTHALDEAFIDRVTPFIVNYLPEEEEVKLLMTRRKGLNEMDAIYLVQMANKLRNVSDTLNTSVSTRKLLTMANYLSYGFTIQEVKEKIFKNIFINGTQNNSDEIIQIFNSNA